MFASPVPTMKRILNEKTVSDFSEVPYVLATCNCALWISYTLVTPGRVMPLITNAIGLIAEIIYCAIFMIYSEGDVHKRICTRVGGVWIFITILVVFAYVAMPLLNISGFLGNNDSAATDFLGIVSSLFNTLMYGSPLSIMLLVIRTQSVEFMPLALTVMVRAHTPYLSPLSTIYSNVDIFSHMLSIFQFYFRFSYLIQMSNIYTYRHLQVV